MDVSRKLKEAVEVARASGEKVVRVAQGAGRSIQESHVKIADHADTIAKTAKVAAGVAVGGAVVAAPTGLAAAGVWLGVVSAPIIVTAAPVLVSAAGIAVTVSAAASLYSKAQKRKAVKAAEVEADSEAGASEVTRDA